MAIYEYRCNNHGTFDEMAKQPSKHKPCPKCGASSPRQWSVPGRHRVTFRDGYSESAGTYFSTKKDRDNWLVANNAVML